MRVSMLPTAALVVLSSTPAAQEFGEAFLLDRNDVHHGYESAGRFTPDGTRMVYLATEQAAPGWPYELFLAPLDGSALPVELSGPMPAGPGVRSFVLSAGGDFVLYFAEQDTVGLPELYAVPLDGGGPPRKLGPTLAVGGSISDSYRLVPHADRVLFTARPAASAGTGVYVSPLDGGAPALLLSGALVPGRDVRTFQPPEPSPDGLRAVYLADQDTDELVELYAVPIDGSEPPLKLNGTVSSSGVRSFVVSPDATRVLYRADGDLDGTIDLYGVPIDGSAPPVRLSGAFSGHVGHVAISAASERVVFSQSGNFGTVIGSARLTGGDKKALWGSEYPSARDLTFTADGDRVVFVTEDVDLGVTDGEIVSVSPEGSYLSAVVLESYSFGTLTGGAYPIEVSPDSEHVAFVDVPYYSSSISIVPIDGGPPAVVEVLTGIDGINGFEFLDGGRELLFGGVNPWGAGRLFVAPSDGSLPPDQLDDPPDNYTASYVSSIRDDEHCIAFVTGGYTFPAELWLVSRQVRLASVSPASGSHRGGTAVRIEGAGFSRHSRVEFGGRPAAAVLFVDDETLLATSPPFAFPPAGRRRALVALEVDVKVSDLDSEAVLRAGFRYERR